MSSAPIQTRSFGPFVKGLVDTWPDGLNGQGVLRRAEGVYLWGDGRLRSMRWPASDRGASPANPSNDRMTHVLAAVNAVSYANPSAMIRWYLAFQGGTASADTRKIQLFQGPNVLNPWWYDRSLAGALTASTTLFAVLVSTPAAGDAPSEDLMRTPPETTMVAAGTMLYVALDTLAGAYFTVDTTTMTVTPNPGGVVVRGVFLFQRHVWGYGGATRQDGGKLLFGTPDYGALSTAAAQTFNLPDYNQGINSIYQVVVVRESAIVCTARGYYRLTGYGANTWQVTRLSLRLGAAGRRSACSGPDAAYVMDRSGRVWRVTDADAVPLPRINTLVNEQYDLSKAVLGYDEENQWVVAAVPLSQRAPTRSDVWVYDVQREQWVSGPTSLGFVVYAMSVYAAQDSRETFGGSINNALLTPPTIGAVTSPGAGQIRVPFTTVAFSSVQPKIVVEVKRTLDGPSMWEPYYTDASPTSPYVLTGFVSGNSYDVRLWYDNYTVGRSAYSATATIVVT